MQDDIEDRFVPKLFFTSPELAFEMNKEYQNIELTLSRALISTLFISK